MTELSWVAIRKGSIYCAPACGGGCTWAAYKKAQSDANKTAAELGRGRVGEVFENLGWHWTVRNADLSIDVSRGHVDKFSAIIARRWSGSGHSPRLAIRDAVIGALPELEELRGLVTFLERAKASLSRKSKKRIIDTKELAS